MAQILRVPALYFFGNTVPLEERLTEAISILTDAERELVLGIVDLIQSKQRVEDIQGREVKSGPQVKSGLTSVCGTGGRGFKSHRSPFFGNKKSGLDCDQQLRPLFVVSDQIETPYSADSGPLHSISHLPNTNFAFPVPDIPTWHELCTRRKKQSYVTGFSEIMDSATPPFPLDELERLEALRRYGAFGLLRATAFDDIARLAAFICQAPISLISLIDTNRQWFLSQSGISACETSREASFCAHALIGTDMLVVEDAQNDARFAHNVMVTGEPFIRFYAGAPLLTPDGYALGTLCVVDSVPRSLTPVQKDALQSLSRLVMTQLEVTRMKRELRILKQSFIPRPAPR
jgi:hypothetical protein